MSLPGVSIVIDSYNHEKFVGQAIESALAQDHQNCEVIVVDDGSRDCSRDVIRGYLPDIRFETQSNLGQVACCRRGFELAMQDIVIFLDSDDLLAPSASTRVAERWTASTSKIQWPLRVIDADGSYQGSVFPRYSSGLSPRRAKEMLLKSGSYPDSPTSGNAYSRRLLQSVLPILPRRNGVDGELNGTAPLFGDVLTLSDPLGSYRIHGANDYALETLDPERFARYCRHSEERFAFVRKFWARHGIDIPIDAIDKDLKYQEYRLVEGRLDKPNCPRLEAMKNVILAARFACERPYSRVLRAACMALILFLPMPLARVLIEQRYVPQKRWTWVRQLAG